MARQLEARLVNEWLFANYPTSLQWRRVRLGPVPTKEYAAMYKVILRWADAIAFDGNTVVIIEGKMRPEPGAISQLEEYEKLLRQTPEFAHYWDRPVKKVLLTTIVDENLKQSCEQRGIAYEVYTPKWAEDYLRQKFRIGAGVPLP